MESRLTKRRKQLGLTMKQVAEYVGVSEATVSRWESGAIANMRRDRIYKYAKILGVRPSFIMGEDAIGDELSFKLSDHERRVITAYHEQKEMQPAVDRILGIAEEPELYIAARGGKVKLDKETAAALAKSAKEAPNSAHNKDMF